ncbi:hypothetical protein BP6252_05383 [Coleophoma cylindrospora]|uniref:Uncharacterized protein n=1 Tax=Coleophoma cylindrospora TaxID=1849047 RepID=A0A3D8RTP3_9HELO|nr:hypothetical protein BP6252_05383 [Coleophoma cylindrospora]
MPTTRRVGLAWTSGWRPCKGSDRFSAVGGCLYDCSTGLAFGASLSSRQYSRSEIFVLPFQKADNQPCHRHGMKQNCRPRAHPTAGKSCSKNDSLGKVTAWQVDEHEASCVVPPASLVFSPSSAFILCAADSVIHLATGLINTSTGPPVALLSEGSARVLAGLQIYVHGQQNKGITGSTGTEWRSEDSEAIDGRRWPETTELSAFPGRTGTAAVPVPAPVQWPSKACTTLHIKHQVPIHEIKMHCGGPAAPLLQCSAGQYSAVQQGKVVAHAPRSQVQAGFES